MPVGRKILVLLCGGILAGCSSTPTPPQLDTSVRKPLNRHLQADPTASKHLTQMRLSVAQALEYYVPPGFHVFTDEGVDLSAVIRYDNSRPWTESLGASLARAGVEMVAALDKKTVLLKPLPTNLGQVLEAHVPADFKVYVDDGIDVKTAIKFDYKKPWVEEMGRSLNAIGLDLIANLDKKIILIRKTMPVDSEAKGPTVKTVRTLAQRQEATY